MRDPNSPNIVRPKPPEICHLSLPHKVLPVCSAKPISQCVNTGNRIVCTETETSVISCKFCGSKNVIKFGLKEGIQYYFCRDCKRKFAGNNALPGMRYQPEVIAFALNMFYEGLSLNAIRRQIDLEHHLLPSDSTVYEWVVRFTKEAVLHADTITVHVGTAWVADETVLEIDGKNAWFWDVIDDETRFLIASHLSMNRGTRDAQTLMTKAYERTKKSPEVIITDALRSYLDGIELVFGSESEHIISKGFKVQPNTNLIERFHGTIKQRTKVMRGMKNIETARLIMDGWLVHYNFFRPHESLKGKTPGGAAKANYLFKNWEDVVKHEHHPTKVIVRLG